MPDKLYATPRLTICLPTRKVNGERVRGDEIAHVDGLAERDHARFTDELGAAICHENGIPYRMSFDLFETHVDNPAGFAKPVGLGSDGDKEIAAFARSVATTISHHFIDSLAKEHAA